MQWQQKQKRFWISQFPKKCHGGTEPRTSNKMDIIIEFCQQQGQDKIEQAFLENFKKTMKVQYIYESNVASSVGTQNLDEIAKILFKRILVQSDENTDRLEEKETLNIEMVLRDVEKDKTYPLK